MRQGEGKPDAMVTPGRDGPAAILRDPGTSTPGGRPGAARRAVRRRRARVRALRDHPSRPEVRRPRRRGAARQGPQGRDRAADACDCRLAKGIRIGGLSRPRSQGPRQTALPEPKRRPSGQGRRRRHPGQACGRGEEVRCRHPRGRVAPLASKSGATGLPGSGASLVHIRDLLGHRSVTTTEIYATAGTARKRELLEKAIEDRKSVV